MDHEPVGAEAPGHQEFRRLGLEYSPKVLCTVKLSRRLYPQERRHNLDSLIQRHSLSCDTRHRALADARATVDVLHGLMERVGNLGVRSLTELQGYITAEIDATALGIALNRTAELAEWWPCRPGMRTWW